MKNIKLSRSTFSIIIPIGLIFFLFTFSQLHTTNGINDFQWNSERANQIPCGQELILVDEKHKGAHVFGTIDSSNFQPLINNNIEWVTLVEWGYQDDYDSPIVIHHTEDSLRVKQHDSKWRKQIKLLRKAGFKVFFKPHLWLWSPTEGKWRSDIYPTSEENWEAWKKSYLDFILRYARIAEQAEAEMFCVGTELTKLTIGKPDFWKKLIQEVRTVYSGKITYAANWYEEFKEITFWEDLDFIGIQAYFPLVKNKYPRVQQISQGWKKYFPVMESIHEKYKRKILFTEMGYKSTADSAIEPWKWVEHTATQDKLYSTETQANCYEAFFNTVWGKDWFAGVHIWQWRSKYKRESGKYDLNFTPQGKTAETIIANGFE